MSERPRPPDMDPTTWRFQNMGEAIIRREVEIQRLRGLLARLEWAGTHCERDRELAACPVCGVLADSEVVGQRPHEPGCWLAAELRTARP